MNRCACSLSSHGHPSCPSAGQPGSRSAVLHHLSGVPGELSVRADGLGRRWSLSEHQELAVLAKVSDQVFVGLSQWCVVYHPWFRIWVLIFRMTGSLCMLLLSLPVVFAD